MQILPFGFEEHGMSLHYFVNDVLMAVFFGIAAKEVRESLLPGGSLSSPRKAAMPLMATVGGMAGPALLFLGGTVLMGRPDLVRGWAIPCATDIAFSYLVARLIFGKGHPAIAFLLMLAIADDAGGLIILAIAYPQKPIEVQWFFLTGIALMLCLMMRRFKVHSFWWYLLGPGVLSWISFQWAGIHAALGIVPVVCLGMPHAHTDLGIFAREEGRKDTLNEFDHWWKNPTEIILGLFALTNAGVVLSSVGQGTAFVLIGLVIGKPLGITVFTLIGEKVFGLKLAEGMTYRHIISLGMVAGIGFTVALFVSTAAFPEPGPVQDAVKMGALGSFFAAVIAFIGARMLGVKPLHSCEAKRRTTGRPPIS